MRFTIAQFFLTFLLLSTFETAKSQSKQANKIEDATVVLQDFIAMKENIPAELLKVTQGIIIVPNMINAGFVVAGKRGKGLAMVKLGDGHWSNPVFVTITGGSVGFQAGIQSVDLVLVFTSAATLQEIENGTFTLGGDISITAGPVGRSSTASTDYKMEAEVYSYSRSKGLFAGISLSGSAIEINEKANKNFYSASVLPQDLFASSEATSAPVQRMKAVLKEITQ